jgi:hypothetical protein
MIDSWILLLRTGGEIWLGGYRHEGLIRKQAGYSVLRLYSSLSVISIDLVPRLVYTGSYEATKEMASGACAVSSGKVFQISLCSLHAHKIIYNISLIMFCILTMQPTHPTSGTWSVRGVSTPSRVHHQRTQAMIQWYHYSRRQNGS